MFRLALIIFLCSTISVYASDNELSDEGEVLLDGLDGHHKKAVLIKVGYGPIKEVVVDLKKPPKTVLIVGHAELESVPIDSSSSGTGPEPQSPTSH